ncbi:TRAM domain-containing protein [Candidatus Sumerlaeota bacterium]|nr:TRAM domain-containing protein [Candidatus Sumerlaeota bacterium]
MDDRRGGGYGRFLNEFVLTRLFFVLIMAWFFGVYLGQKQSPPRVFEYTVLSLLVSSLIVLFESSAHIMSPKKILFAIVGLLFGLVLGSQIYQSVPPTLLGDPFYTRIGCNLICGYLGIMLALKNVDYFDLSRLRFILGHPRGNVKVLDTSVIIDGRIRDLAAGRFVPETLLVPQFVIQEIQSLADSNDSAKRAKGRRGLAVLEEMRAMEIPLTIYENDYPNIASVDQKLIAVARETEGELITNDFNLQKVAMLHQVRTLNLNELANILKPTAYVGETIPLHVTESGEQPRQGVGYLDDGTMVVVENGEESIGQEILVTVTSILQTSRGRMIFSRLALEKEQKMSSPAGKSRLEK